MKPNERNNLRGKVVYTKIAINFQGINGEKIELAKNSELKVLDYCGEMPRMTNNVFDPTKETVAYFTCFSLDESVFRGETYSFSEEEISLTPVE